MKSLPVQIQENLIKLIDPGSDLVDLDFLLAVSGGKDSMVMAHSFLSLGLKFGIAHFNFQLRGKSSDMDVELVRAFCSENDLTFHCMEKDTKNFARSKQLSIQEAARELRYEFFDDLVNSDTYDYICTAHHGNDQLETFFIHLFRGSGLKGLTGIPSRRGQILRPMLWIPQYLINRYADKNGVKFREDESNKSDKYLRNRIRHHIIKPITDTEPGSLNKSLDSIQLITEYQEYMDIQLNQFTKSNIRSFSDEIDMVGGLNEIINHASNSFLLKLYLLERGLYPDSIRDLVSSEGNWQTGKKYEGDCIDAWYDRNQLWLVRESFYNGWNSDDKIELPRREKVLLPGGDRVKMLTQDPDSEAPNLWNIPVNRGLVQLPLYLRHRQPGDTIETGSFPYYRKSIKKILNEFKIPRPFKDRLYLLVDSKDRIISVPGLIDSSKYTSNQDNILWISYNSDLSF